MSKYDLFGLLFSSKSQASDFASSNGNGASFGNNVAFENVPSWDPVSGIRSAARSTDKFGSNRYVQST